MWLRGLHRNCAKEEYENLASITSQLFAITFKVAFHLTQTVAAKLFSHRGREHERDHRFANHAAGRHYCDIRAFKGGALLLLRVDINRAQGATQRRYRFQMAAHANLFAV